ncbi:MAG: hypothetical protein AVW06_01030 [Hadesarchaea archaeon DG-33-1]|nr:MAG: hypothetical protein AVW06_01030 [Hadesarchaea archaeon DG-33-1]
MVFVTKFDGTRQPFDRNKVIGTCIKKGVNRAAAETIADMVESKVYDGIPTKKILQMIFAALEPHRPAIKHQTNLREAISLLRSKPDFENFVQLLLKEHGYKVDPNRIVRGKCIEHEIDAIAGKNGETILVEIKHHFDHHTRTHLDVSRQVRATFEDLVEGFGLGLNSVNFSKALIVCNTKFSEHARQYAKCRGIACIGWNSPPEHGLEQMIEEKNLHPITLIKGLDAKTEEKLGDNGVILVRQLIEHDLDKLSRRTGIKKDKLAILMKKAREIISG